MGHEPGDRRPAEADRPAERGGDEDDAPAGDPLDGHASPGGAPSIASERADGSPDSPAEPPRGSDSHGAPVTASVTGAGGADRAPAAGDTPGSWDEPRETADARPADPRVGDSGRPKPLHDPDPYGTPPYGEPGPWAPAPPIQHPMAPPTQATPATAPPSPVPPAEPSAPGPDGEPGPWASAPSVHGTSLTAASVPVSPAESSAPDPHAGPAPWAPAPPAHGAPLADAPASPPAVPAPAQSPEAAPAPAPQQDSAAPRYDPWNPLPPSHQAAPATAPHQWPGWKKVLGVFLGVTLVAAGVGGFLGAWVEREGTTTVRLPSAGAVPEGRERDSVAGIAARALPGVVTLHVRGGDESGTGTGFVLDGRGHILTNNHVVAPASGGGDITVTFSSGDTAEAEVVGRDSGYDLAVVQVKGVQGLTPLTLGDSDAVRVGDPVVAIGAPFDLANTVTSGIVSAKDRPITAGGEKGDGTDVSYVDALQTDAPINPGNSGGPLLDAHARVIGVNSAIRSADRDADSTESRSGSIGLGFAIPANQARRVAEELINTGHATHPVIGVTLDMDYAGDGARIDTEGGAAGPAVQKDGPGDRAGLKPGDLITGVDGHPVHSGEELIVKIRAHRPGDRLRLTVGSPGAEHTVTLRLGASGRN
ncbi:PDZ domain-containing protein [Streptomyces bauhiniae]|uniref:PDZ domain-containing protein n=1 Tax=Streptomyces bauhiniae TaxID=2340725 RepID=A0A4Z1DE65_9ACTN|nr:trypsin-like peptidase domain-containing protein [Streptomyces bauhiniae]TGN81486.1 PDZ domain-containing protein [Streptomyces bauhiniae]